MSDLTTVARPYAKAAFDYAVEHQVIAQWSEMLSFCAQVAADDAMADIFASGERPARIAEIFLTVAEGQIDEPVSNLIRLMAENSRLPALPAVFELFEALCAELNQVVDVAVVSPSALTDAQQQTITAAMEKRLDRKVKLNCSIDESLIGGIVIKAGDTVIDGSVRGKLERLTETLQA